MPELTVIAEQLLVPLPGGTGRYTRELLCAMAECVPPGWELSSVVSSSGDPQDAVVPGVTGPRVLRLPRRGLVAAWERGVPVWPGGDSVHAMTPLAPPSRRGRGLVVTVHDTVPWSHPETLTSRGVSWHRRMISRAARTADVIVAPTDAVATDLTQRMEVKATMSVVPEGVNLELAQKSASLPFDLPPRYVLAIGTIEPRKRYDDLVRAVAETDLPLIVVGGVGWGDVDLPRVADECGLPRDRLRLLGAVDDGVLATVLRGATVVAVPSLAEGFGLPVIEAMSVGVPVVHSDAPALAEVAGGAGVSTPRADPNALARGLREAVRRRTELAAAGTRRARQFTWEKAARAVWGAHQAMIESSCS